MWKEHLVRELAVILVIKLVALYVLWLAFFSQPDEQALSEQQVGQRLLGEPHTVVTPPYRPKAIQE